MNKREDILKNFIKYEDETNDRVIRGIEQNRKGFFEISVKDKNGNPLPGVKVKAKLTKHEFMHGANIFMLDEFENEEKNIAYRELFKNVFNGATIPFYWGDLEPEEGKPRFDKNSPKIYRRPATDLCLEYCEENNITPKAHCLTDFSFTPDWVSKTDIGDMKQKLEKRYETIANRYKNRIVGWEVINELLCCTKSNLAHHNPFFVADDVLDWNFKLAEKYFGANHLIINEATPHMWLQIGFKFSRSAYYTMIQQGIERGLRIDSVGMQCHCFESQGVGRKEFEADLYDPRNLFTVLDTYEKLGRPIQITEVTVPAYSDSAEDEEIQAEIVERLYSIWFSHKATEAVMYWNLPDGYAAFAPMGDMTAGENFFRGGLLRFDLSRKPAYDMIHHLFRERWTTNESFETSQDGTATFKGFYGEYDVEADGKHITVKTSKVGKNHFEIIL